MSAKKYKRPARRVPMVRGVSLQPMKLPPLSEEIRAIVREEVRGALAIILEAQRRAQDKSLHPAWIELVLGKTVAFVPGEGNATEDASRPISELTNADGVVEAFYGAATSAAYRQPNGELYFYDPGTGWTTAVSAGWGWQWRSFKSACVEAPPTSSSRCLGSGTGVYVGGKEVTDLSFIPNGHPTGVYVGGKMVYG